MGFGYLKEAEPPLLRSLELDGDSFDNRIKLGELERRLAYYDLAESQIQAARKLARKDEEKAAVLELRVANDLAVDRLDRRVDELRRAIAAKTQPTVDDYLELARYEEAGSKLPEAVRSAMKAVALAPRSILGWTLVARLQESAGELGASADSLRKLGDVDRKNRAEYLTDVARLEARLGRIDAALKAGRDLIKAAPGNPEHYDFFAQLCFQLGQTDLGLDVLRRAVRVNPADDKILLTLADNLASAFKGEEALETYWRAFDKAPDLDARVGVVASLANLSIQLNQFDRMLARLRRRQSGDDAGEKDPEREVAICLAQALASSGDLGGARAELERLLASNARDPQILNQLAKLAEDERDYESAARYQKQLTDLAPTEENQSRLGDLYARAGDLENAQDVWSRMAAGKGETGRVFAALDRLLGSNQYDPVERSTETLLRKNPQSWEALDRRGQALVGLKKYDEADECFLRMERLTGLSDDERSSQAKARGRGAGQGMATALPSSRSGTQSAPIQDRLAHLYLIRVACGLQDRGYSRSTTAQAAWAADDFGQARITALGFRLVIADLRQSGSSQAVIDQYRARAARKPVDLHALWDWYYLCQLRLDNAQAHEAGRQIGEASPNDPIAFWAYLHAVGQRSTPFGQQYYVSSSRIR